jgi:hypothetical protein
MNEDTNIQEPQGNGVLPCVSISLLCINDAVEGEGLTEYKYYEPICKYKDCYCIVDDNDELEVYHEGFFKVVSNEC